MRQVKRKSVRAVDGGECGQTAKCWHPLSGKPVPTGISAVWKRRARTGWIAAVMLCTVNLLPSARAAEPVNPREMHSGTLLFEDADGYRLATRLNTSVDARVSGIVARVSVRQEFRNDGPEWAEGIYVFPLPDSAAVDHLRMYAGDRYIEGEIREKADARKQYESARSEGRKASLVEQERANLFTTSVANIGPGESITIEIEYLETLRYDEGTFSLRIPTAVTPRYVPGTGVEAQGNFAGLPAPPAGAREAIALPVMPQVARSADHTIAFTADIDAGVPLSVIASRYHMLDIIDLGGRYQVGLADGIAAMNRDIELTWRPEPHSAPRAMLFTEIIGGKAHALLMVLPPEDAVTTASAMPRDLVFVIDTSGSMHGTSMEQARRALGVALGGLRPTDRFNVIEFNSATHSLFPDSMPASAANIAVAQRYVSGLTANGGTEMAPAIALALTPPGSGTHLRQVIFITDGSVGNEEALYRQIERQLGASRLFTIGIGSAPNGWFMRKAAEAGRGTFTTIGSLHEVGEKMERLFRKLERPQVTNVRVEWPSGNAIDAFPAEVPDLYAGDPIVVRARLGQAPQTGDLVRVSGSSVAGGWQADLPFATGESRPGIGALWARARIEHLLDQARRGADGDSIRRAVVDTALTHHLVSRYTSLVAVDKSPERMADSTLRTDPVPGLLPNGQANGALTGFPATATSAPLSRLAGLLLFVAALTVLLWRRPARHAPV